MSARVTDLSMPMLEYKAFAFISRIAADKNAPSTSPPNTALASQAGVTYVITATVSLRGGLRSMTVDIQHERCAQQAGADSARAACIDTGTFGQQGGVDEAGWRTRSWYYQPLTDGSHPLLLQVDRYQTQGAAYIRSVSVLAVGNDNGSGNIERGGAEHGRVSVCSLLLPFYTLQLFLLYLTCCDECTL